MSTNRIPSLTAATFAALLACQLPAQAVAGATPVAAAATSDASAKTFQQLVDHLVAQGYRDVREIERKSDKLYEVKARDAGGAWVELTVDARSGEVLKTEIDNDHKRR